MIVLLGSFTSGIGIIVVLLSVLGAFEWRKSRDIRAIARRDWVIYISVGLLVIAAAVFETEYHIFGAR